MIIFIIIMLSTYIFTNRNVTNIEHIDKHELPISILHAKNFSLLENLINNFTDASITGEKESLVKTVAIKSRILNNLDVLKSYHSNLAYLKALVEDYYIQAYSISFDIIENKSEIKIQRFISFQKNSKEIFSEFEKHKNKSSKILIESLKNISDSSKVFFKNSFIMSIIGFLLVLIIGVVTYGNINNRFKTILNLVKNLTVEKPDFSLELKDNHNDELGKLTKLFQKISFKLENINHILEKKIEIAVEKTKKQEQKLIEQSRLAQMGEMISMIAHQWRQPLNIINSLGMRLSFMAEDSIINPKEILEITENIELHTQHMSQTIDDFRNFFEPRNEKVETNFNLIVKNTLTLVEASLKSKNIEIIIETKELREINIYENEMIQVILNIIKNAEDALVEKKVIKPFIKISIYTMNSRNILEIKDNAGGIKTKVINKIFEPYFSTKDKQEGTGLGLYMSKMIINEHCNGQLSAENDEYGAVFKIII